MAVPVPELWPHQEQAIAAVLRGIAAGLRAGMVVLPTGTGKTAMFLSLARRLGLPTLVVLNRDVLVGQTRDAAARFWPGVRVATVAGGLDTSGGGQELTVALVQSLHARKLAGLPRDRFGLVIADEAHFAACPQWDAALDHFEAGFTLGVTATPERSDGRPLKRFGAVPLFAYPLHQAIADGRLVRLVQQGARTGVDLDRVETKDGDFGLVQLGRAVDTPARNSVAVQKYLEVAAGRKALAFACSIEHAGRVAAAFAAAGVPAAALSSQTPAREQDRLLAEFRAGWLAVLVSCDMLTTGFDEPSVDCIVMCRPTASRSLYVQMVGRGLRLCPETGKTDCLVIDLTDNCRRHKLVTALDLLGRPPGAPAGQAPPPRPAGENAAAAVAADVSWELEEVCPWPALPSLDGYEPTKEWHDAPASPGQLRCLASFGLRAGRDLTKGEASYLIERAQEYDAFCPVPATPKQAWTLRQAGLWADGMGRRQASLLITQLKTRERCLAQ